MSKEHLNIRLSHEGAELIDRIAESLTARSETGKACTKTEVVERALRLLARKELPKKGE